MANSIEVQPGSSGSIAVIGAGSMGRNHARVLQAKIEGTPEFVAWKKAETEKQLAALGAFLQALDTMTGLPTSSVYRTVLNIWRGDHDYLSYLKTIAG